MVIFKRKKKLEHFFFSFSELLKHTFLDTSQKRNHFQRTSSSTFTEETAQKHPYHYSSPKSLKTQLVKFMPRICQTGCNQRVLMAQFFSYQNVTSHEMNEP